MRLGCAAYNGHQTRSPPIRTPLTESLTAIEAVDPEKDIAVIMIPIENLGIDQEAQENPEDLDPGIAYSQSQLFIDESICNKIYHVCTLHI